ncbi:MAG: winged helix-turn-helix transcriptional regulator [Candidatus Thorarchaeota archaeon]|nr:MAG: winged helix-turn-helix transcriptional regulator [Candidatus Thorarchaeota archaeon]
MDRIDRAIVWLLDSNCRTTYETMAKKLGLTANAVKKRIDKMIDSGIISQFSVMFSSAMIDADILLALVHTDGSEDVDEIIQQIGSNPLVLQVSAVASGIGELYLIFAQYVGTTELASLGTFLRGIESVKEVNLHNIIYPRGKKMELKKTHLKVLDSLVTDARMSVRNIARETGMTAKRVRRIIGELEKSGAFLFTLRWNISAGGNSAFHLRVDVDMGQTTAEEVAQWLRDKYPRELWYPFMSAIEPVIFAAFVVDDLYAVQRISSEVRKASFVKATAILLSYSDHKFPWPAEMKLRELLSRENG